MALTIIMDTNLEKYDKQARLFGLAGRGIKVAVVKVTFGSGDNYATNGVSADLKVNGIKEIIEVVPADNNAGLVVRYDKTNSKIMLYGYTPTSASAGVIPLDEIANSSTLTQSKIFEFIVIGR